MEFELIRHHSAATFSLGILFCLSKPRKMLAYTIEDEARFEKVPGHTRIPAGRYKLRLRTHGGFHERYEKLFPKMHVGMVELEEVPGFTDVLVHRGNDASDTAGCILVGDTQEMRGWVGHSTAAYRRVYPEMAKPLSEGQPCWITVTDLA